MISKSIILALLLCATTVSCVGVSPCPISNNNGTVYSGQIIAGFNGGIVPLIEGQDSQCYNYSLPYAFSRVPQVAVAVHDFEAQSSTSLFYYIKPIHTDSLGFVPFVIRTQWAYTRWTKIVFSFVAEDRVDIESGYYQIDSGILAGCISGKQIKVLLPFHSAFYPGNQLTHNLFLHGYEISTMPFSQNQRSPYELQITGSTTNSSGITVTFSVTTITQVNSIYISYITYQETSLKVISGSYFYDSANGLGFSHSPLALIPRNYARIYGITGFIINYNQQKIIFGTEWTGHQFYYHLGPSQKLTQYLTFQYIFFTGSQCQDCLGYPISFNGTCVNVCPVNTFLTPENVCLSCGEGRYWNGTACQVSCPRGQFLNPTTQTCQCPPTLNWNGEKCIPCTAGKVFNTDSKSCECRYPLKWNGFACARLPDCQNGQIWDVYTYSCKCPDHMYWTGSVCKDIPLCKGGRILDSRFRCICPTGKYWDGSKCSFSNCVGGQVWDGTQCICPAGRNFNGTICLECINGQEWNNQDKLCQCPSGYEWTGITCKKTLQCSGNRVWNPVFEHCVCADLEYWNGRSCAIKPVCSGGRRWDSNRFECFCPGASKWDTEKCQTCRNGQIWDEPSRQCLCPRGTVWHNNLCRVIQQCSGGMMWFQQIWACQCPVGTVWNGNYCISNPCSNGRVWNDTHRSCQCPDDKIWTSGACLPPQIACTNGRVWDPTIYACTCPTGTYPNINKCDPIPSCFNGQVYNPLNNKCQCPYGLIYQNSRCTEPTCSEEEYWNGHQCVRINCPPLSYYKDHKCVYEPNPQSSCSHHSFWDGNSCQFYKYQCPFGTNWEGSSCKSIGSCQQGYYQNSEGHCSPFPQACLPPTVWNGEKCETYGNCPSGTYSSGDSCQTYVPCQNGHVWDTTHLKCSCPAGQQSNGHNCVQCSGNKEWVAGFGCRCPSGHFDLGSQCEKVDQQRCLSIPNSKWSQNSCHCNEGYSKVGLQCVCYGIQIGSYCDRCSHKSNSVWNGYLCKCNEGYTQIDGQCKQNSQASGSDTPASCSVGSYFDFNHRKCLACPVGCLSCTDCYTCVQCKPDFNYDPTYNRCVERCGDGLKFIDECDDGNNADGDGCSKDCHVEQGYTCTGGSPDTKDNCYVFQPGSVTLSQSGQIRMSTSIILNIRLDYLPQSLIQSADCNNKCLNVLVGEIIEGDKGSTSITSQYIPGSSYSFSVKIEFGRPYIGKFKVRISIDRAIGQKYFGQVSSSQSITIEVSPSYLASVSNEDSIN